MAVGCFLFCCAPRLSRTGKRMYPDAGFRARTRCIRRPACSLRSGYENGLSETILQYVVGPPIGGSGGAAVGPPMIISVNAYGPLPQPGMTESSQDRGIHSPSVHPGRVKLRPRPIVTAVMTQSLTHERPILIATYSILGAPHSLVLTCRITDAGHRSVTRFVSGGVPVVRAGLTRTR